MLIPKEGAELSKIFVKVFSRPPSGGNTRWTATVDEDDKPEAEGVSLTTADVPNLNIDLAPFSEFDIGSKIDGEDWAEAALTGITVTSPGSWQFSFNNVAYPTVCTEVGKTSNMADCVSIATVFLFKQITKTKKTIGGTGAHFIGSYALLAGVKGWNVCDADFAVNFEAMAWDYGWDAKDLTCKYQSPTKFGRDGEALAEFKKIWEKAWK